MVLLKKQNKTTHKALETWGPFCNADVKFLLLITDFSFLILRRMMTSSDSQQQPAKFFSTQILRYLIIVDFTLPVFVQI